MAEPKKRLTSTRSGNRRSHLAKKTQNLTNCLKCQSPALPHQVCLECGFYKDVDVLELEKKEKEKKDRQKVQEEKDDKESGKTK
jgi:large subunit ribosomal protein L32